MNYLVENVKSVNEVEESGEKERVAGDGERDRETVETGAPLYERGQTLQTLRSVHTAQREGQGLRVPVRGQQPLCGLLAVL